MKAKVSNLPTDFTNLATGADELRLEPSQEEEAFWAAVAAFEEWREHRWSSVRSEEAAMLD